MQQPTVSDLTSDDNHFSVLARTTWLNASTATRKVSPSILKDDIYGRLEADGFAPSQLLLLEQLQCLERYLWPGWSNDASDQHVVLIALLVNTKLKANLPAWTVFINEPEHFSSFFRSILRLSIDDSLSNLVRRLVICFVINAFQSLDNALVRKECAPLVSISIWHNMHSDAARERNVARSVQTSRAWRSAGKRFEQAEGEEKAKLEFERRWLYTLLLNLLSKLYDVDRNADERQQACLFGERVLELLCDLQSQLPTRRYVNALLIDMNLLTAVRLSPIYQDEDNQLLREMCLLLEHYTNFPVNDQDGHQLSRKEFDEQHSSRISRLQKAALQLFSEKLKMLFLSDHGSLSQPGSLNDHLRELSDAELLQLCRQVSTRPQYPESAKVVTDRAFLHDALQSFVEQQPYFQDTIRQLPTLPTEVQLYDTSILRAQHFDDSRPLAVPKLNLQYLTMGDFIWRSFVLYRCESFFEIKSHLEDTVKRLQPRKQASGRVVFEGFSRMAIPIDKPAIIETVPARVGEQVPAEVKAEISLDVSRLQPGLRRDWESLRPDDVVFLAAVVPEKKQLANGAAAQIKDNEQAGLAYIRSAEVISLLDDSGKQLRHDQNRSDQNDYDRPRQRRLLLRLDAAAYKADQERAGNSDLYADVNVVVRRRARENNFKAVLESIKSLCISDASLPKWLHDVFLGYGDPSSASYQRLQNRSQKVDFRDTFLDWQHLIEALPGKIIEPNPDLDSSFGPPYVLDSIVNTGQAPVARPNKKRKREAPSEDASDNAIAETVRVDTYKQPNAGPYPADVPKTNSVRFTAAQVEAIHSGTQPGFTMIVGPPGTGKTDVATQIISNIYHDFPTERTLLIAHSNQALNQLFAKIVNLDIDERHLLRLGHGEEDLRTDACFSKAGRVESFLERGTEYLTEVQRLAASISAPGAHGSSCETAAYFEEVYVSPSWKKFWTAAESLNESGDIEAVFPFNNFFANAPQPLFPSSVDKATAIDIARGCERHINKIFEELADIRPFEILRGQREKSNYLLVKEARIIAMTSTHAAIRRQEIAALGFKYDNVIVEEAAQITEMESFLPFALQDSGKTSQELKRIILLGDHLQNCPIVENNALRSFAKLEQSLFLRMVRLGVPYIMLEAQGRARPSLAALYRWRYPRLTNLPTTSSSPEFVCANAGLRFDYQFIDVQDYKGRGETEPSPHFTQNLGEAEFAVALFQYMRLLGYPAEKITILTAYAGQRALIHDVLSHRCKNNRLFGMPAWVSTIDKYQGEQNDYVILSLVRTRGPGYLRDLRRLTVALSRARLGLYVLGRREVFESSLELSEAFSVLLERSETLEVVTGELWPAERKLDDDAESVQIESVEHMGQYVFEMTQAKVNALKEGQGALPPPSLSRTLDAEAEEDADEERDVTTQPFGNSA